MTVRLLRRDFLTGLGLVAAGLSLGAEVEAAPKLPVPIEPELKDATAKKGEGFRPNYFVHVAPDGTVSIVCQRSEMGQGVRSSIPALIADELGAELARIKIVQAPGDARYGDQNTDGSHSIRGSYKELRQLGAVARMMLISAAAKRWKVPEKDCDTKDGKVLHEPSKRSLEFGELANEAARLPLPEAKAIALRPKLRWAGGELPLVDAPDIVTGKAIYGADVKLPGMLTAIVLRPPVTGGSVKGFVEKNALAIPGVKRIIQLPKAQRPFAFKPLGGLAVVADNTWAAMRGRAALAPDVTWDAGAGPNAGYDSREFKQELAAALQKPARTWRDKGDVEKALAADRAIHAQYYAPHLAHATMEPPVAVARIDGKTCEVWAPTQNAQAAKKSVAEALSFKEEDVTIHVTLLGGGFGRKSKPDFCVEAALLAREMGAPVRVQWTRPDDLGHDYYHSVSAQLLSAAIDKSGKVTAWRHRTAFPPIGSTFADTKAGGEGEMQQGVTDVPLDIPNIRAENCEAEARVRIGWLRSVANIYHAFAGQSFMDELAHATGKDPLSMRLELFGPAKIHSVADLGLKSLPNYGQSLDEHPIDSGRHRRVLERVAASADWASRKSKGRALGIAVHRSFLAYIAVVVSVVKAKGPDGKISVDEAWICADVGTVVNLERVKSQLEGAVIFGLSHAMYGEITAKNGVIEQQNFRDFRLMRIKEAPRAIHVDVIPSDAPPSGVGEPGVPPVAPALANAVFALTGQRIRELPLVRSVPI
ncbi:MAG: molybdopterin cofactor-binding domain-containing protein [Labilithrix sp.]